MYVKITLTYICVDKMILSLIGRLYYIIWSILTLLPCNFLFIAFVRSRWYALPMRKLKWFPSWGYLPHQISVLTLFLVHILYKGGELTAALSSSLTQKSACSGDEDASDREIMFTCMNALSVRRILTLNVFFDHTCSTFSSWHSDFRVICLHAYSQTRVHKPVQGSHVPINVIPKEAVPIVRKSGMWRHLEYGNVLWL